MSRGKAGICSSCGKEENPPLGSELSQHSKGRAQFVGFELMSQVVRQTRGGREGRWGEREGGGEEARTRVLWAAGLFKLAHPDAP